MMRRFITILMMIVALMGMAATVENEFFSISTPDDSWFLANDDALRPYGARVDVTRLDARGATLELARIDYIEGAFDPTLYLQKQVVGKKDIFCHSATEFTDIYPSTMAGFEAQSVGFKKSSNNYTYDCEAVAFTAGYGTFLVIMAHRTGDPSLIGRIVGTMRCKTNVTPLHTTSLMVQAAQKVVAKHHLPIGNNEHLSGVEMAPDTTTVTLKITVPYITKESVNVPAFVMTKRDAWFRQAPEALKFNLLLATATRERKLLRYLYVDTKGNEIGTLLIYPEEYDQVEQLEAERIAREEAARLAKEEADRAAKEAAEIAAREAAEREAQEAARIEASKPIIYEVKRGDSLNKIAKQFGVSVQDIKNANPSLKNDKIQLGHKLTIPRR
jgi:uncharacterized protein YlzI (FlbEa/FlbD family)